MLHVFDSRYISWSLPKSKAWYKDIGTGKLFGKLSTKSGEKGQKNEAREGGFRMCLGNWYGHQGLDSPSISENLGLF